MSTVWLYSLLSVLAVSTIALIGIFTVSLRKETLKRALIHMVSFAAGALFGDAFLHLLPEAVEESGGFTAQISAAVLGGIIIFLIVEKIIHWHHCHLPAADDHVHPFVIMNLVGDGVHNLIDGLIIGASYAASVPIGLATTLAVVLHEVPQEIGDFGIMLHGGFSTRKALLLNFLTALTSVIGVVIALTLTSRVEGITLFFLPFAAGGFIYIAGSDLIPELRKECDTWQNIIQLVTFLLGVAVMVSLLLIG